MNNKIKKFLHQSTKCKNYKKPAVFDIIALNHYSTKVNNHNSVTKTSTLGMEHCIYNTLSVQFHISQINGTIKNGLKKILILLFVCI